MSAGAIHEGLWLFKHAVSLKEVGIYQAKSALHQPRNFEYNMWLDSQYSNSGDIPCKNGSF